MAITLVSNQPATSGWCINATSADATGCEFVVAAPTTGNLYLCQVLVSSAAAISVDIGATDAAGDTGVDHSIISFYMAANTTQRYVFREPIELASVDGLAVDASGAGAICVVAEGYTA